MGTTDMDTLGQKLLRRAQRLGLQRSDAEDLAQEALLRLMQRMHRTEIETPEHYAMIILHNLARARWRARVELSALEEDTSTAPQGDIRLAVVELRRAIAALPPDQARIMEMVVQGEPSPRIIAARLDLPQGTVMSRLARARVTLRREVGLEAGMQVADLL